MERIVDLVLENKLSELREATHQRIASKIGSIMESHKKKVAASGHKKGVNRIASDPRQHSKGFHKSHVAHHALMVRGAHRYGYLHESTNVEPGGKCHTFIHQNGHVLKIHTGGKAFWSHSLTGNDGLAVHLGTGDDPKGLLQHLEAIHGGFDPKAYFKSRAKQLKESNRMKAAEALSVLREAYFSYEPPKKDIPVAHTEPYGENRRVHKFNNVTNKFPHNEMIGNTAHPQVRQLQNAGHHFVDHVQDASGGISHKYSNGEKVGPFHSSDYINHDVKQPENHQNHPMHGTISGYGYKHAETRSAMPGQYEHRYLSPHPNLPHMSLLSSNANHTYAAAGKGREPVHQFLQAKTERLSDTDHHIIAKSFSGEHKPAEHPTPLPSKTPLSKDVSVPTHQPGTAKPAPTSEYPKQAVDIHRTVPFKVNTPIPNGGRRTGSFGPGPIKPPVKSA